MDRFLHKFRHMAQNWILIQILIELSLCFTYIYIYIYIIHPKCIRDFIVGDYVVPLTQRLKNLSEHMAQT